MLPWIFKQIFEDLSKTRERQFVCARSKRSHASARHVENFKTTISPLEECYLSSNLHIHIHFLVAPKKPTVFPLLPFSGHRPGIGPGPIYQGGKRCRNDALFFCNVVLFTFVSFVQRFLVRWPLPWDRETFVSLSSSMRVERSNVIKRSGDM